MGKPRKTKRPPMWIREQRDYGETVDLIAQSGCIVMPGDVILDDVALWDAYVAAAEAAGLAWSAVLKSARPSTAKERNARRRSESPDTGDEWLPIEDEET